MEFSAAPASKPVPLWREVVRFHADHWGAVAKTLLPPTLTADAIAIFLHHQIQIVYRHLVPENDYGVLLRSGVLGYQRLMLPVTLLNLLKQWSLWACYCFAAVGICVVVSNISRDQEADESAFATIREHPTRFLKASSLFFGMLVIAFLFMTIFIARITDFQQSAHLKVPAWESPLVGILAFALVSSVLVRWIFAVPLVSIHGLSFRKALKISDRITDYRALALWTLILESEVTGYYAWKLPWWAFSHLHAEATMFSYYATYGTAILLAAMSQAPLMIAVGLVMQRWEAGEIPMPNRPAEPVQYGRQQPMGP